MSSNARMVVGGSSSSSSSAVAAASSLSSVGASTSSSSAAVSSGSAAAVAASASGAAPGNPVPPGGAGSAAQERLFRLVLDLTDGGDTREAALLELSKQRETYPDLALILWHSVGTVSCLLQEVIAIYPLLQHPQSLTPAASNRCCNALALLQCIASHSDTRSLFLHAHVPLFLYPFLNTHHAARPFEYLRLTSLGVIGALVKMDDADVISFLLQTEIIPLCLRIMDSGSELSKTVATFIVQKILLDPNGLKYVCATPDRFYAVTTAFAHMVNVLTRQPSVRLLKHIIRCFLRLADNTRARQALRQSIPPALKTSQFDGVLSEDHNAKKWHTMLLNSVFSQSNPASAAAGGGQSDLGGLQQPSAAAGGTPTAASAAGNLGGAQAGGNNDKF